MNFMLLVAFAFGICSCDDTIEDAIPQSNTQEAAVTVDDIVLNKTLPEAISLKELADQGDTVRLFHIEEVKNLPANSSVDFVLQFSNREDFSKYGTLDVTVDKGVAFVLASEWQNQYLSVVGRSPKAKDIFVRYEAYMVKNGTSIVRMGGPEVFVGESQVNVTPYPSELVIEDNYYLLGTVNGWSVAEALPFSHTGDPYDNPVFTIKVDISPEQAAAGWWWKIVPESTYKTGNWVDADNASFGVAENGSEASEGLLVGRTATTDCGAGCLKLEGQLLLTINMEEGTYAFSSAVDYLYTPGQANGWSQTASQMLYTDNYADYYGYAYLDAGGFKFSNAPDWKHTNYGVGAAEGTLSTTGGNISPAATGLYWCSVNTAALTYTLYEISTIGVIGDATSGGWDVSSPLTATDAMKLVWEGDVTLKNGTMKFRANDAWDANLGGSLDDLRQKGSDIAVKEGTYHVVLDLRGLPYKATLTAK